MLILFCDFTFVQNGLYCKMFFHTCKGMKILIFLAAFLAIGYYDCDALFYKKLLKDNNIKTAEQAYDWFQTINSEPTRTNPNSQPRDIYNYSRGWWCDEGAWLMQRLVLYSSKENCQFAWIYSKCYYHVVLQVFENDKNRYVTYDTRLKCKDCPTPYFKMVCSDNITYEIRHISFLRKVLIFAIDHNRILKYVAMKFRELYY